MARRSMSRGKDKLVFRNTAIGSKKINLNPTIYRGGIRL